MEEYGRMVLSGLLLAAGMILQATDADLFRQQGVAVVWYLAAYLPVALPVLKEAWKELTHREYFNEFTLMFIATVGAFAIGEYPEGVAVMLFYSLGEHFQEKAVSKARRDISALLDIRPEKATVVRDGRLVEVSPQDVQTGETIEVKAGGRVPLDGTLCNESATFNTAALTGESLPRDIGKDGEVLAGMISTGRTVQIRVTRPFTDSALSRILRMVQDASERKAPAELFIRKFARIYTPAVTVLAVLIVLFPWLWSLCGEGFTYVFSDWLYRALVFLVVSCPCALVVSIPLSYFGGIGAASRQGVLFKGGNYLDAISRINTVVFDKTGTLTRGEFDVQTCVPRPGISEEQLIRLAASAEQDSPHPLAAGLTRYAEERQVELLQATDVEEIAGCGVRATLEGRSILVGNTRLLEREGIAYPPALNEAKGTTVACAAEGHYIITPDNGTLTHIKRMCGIEEARIIDETVNRLPNSGESYTFHGRDIYAYTGARLASGVITFQQVGPQVPVESVIELPVIEAEFENDVITGTIDVLDVRFGSLWTNIPREMFAKLGVSHGGRVEVSIANDTRTLYKNIMVYAKSFADVNVGEPLLYVNSLDCVAVAINQGSFSKTYNIGTGINWRIALRKAPRIVYE